MKQAIFLLFSIFMFAFVFPTLWSCNTQSRESCKIFDNTPIKLIRTVAMAPKTQNETVQAMVSKYKSYDNNFQTCEEYNEPYEPRFFYRPTAGQSFAVNLDYSIAGLYSLSSLKELESRKNTSQCYSTAQFSDMASSVGKTALDKEVEFEGNSEYFLDRMLQGFLDGNRVRYQIKSEDSNIFRNKIQILYNGALRAFLATGDQSAESVVRNMIIPFGNKIHCLLFNKDKRDFCKNCKDITDVFECCSKTFYSLEEKKRGEEYVKNAVEYAKREVLKKKENSELYYTQDGNICFYGDFPMELFVKNLDEYMDLRPLN